MASFNKIRSGSIVEIIVSEITNAVLDKKLKPGDKLPTETEMADNFGVSRTSIREAMKMLSALGLIEIKRGNGTYITTEVQPNTFDTLMYAVILEQSNKSEVLELRKMLEIDILELAVLKATEEDIEFLENLLNEFKKEFEEGNFDKAAKLDYDFHKALVKVARNKLFEKMVLAVYDFFFKSIEKTIVSYEAREKKAIRIHSEMLELIKSRDTGKVAEVVESSLEGWRLYI